MRKGDAEKYLQRLNEWFGFQPESGEVLYKREVTVSRLAQIFKVSLFTIYNWRDGGDVVETRMMGREKIYLLGDVLRQIECATLGQPNPLRPAPAPQPISEEAPPSAPRAVDPPQLPAVPADPAPSVLPPMPMQAIRERLIEKVPAPVMPASSDPFQVIQARAAKSAREAYRDVILDAADTAEDRGDKDLQIRLLKDFIFAEETLTVYVAKEVKC